MAKSARKVWQPRAHQKVGLKWLLKRPEAMLFWHPGLGKTSVATAAWQLLREKGNAGKVLVVAPRRVCQNVWTQEPGGELAEWEQFRDIEVVLLHGDEKEKRITQDGDVYVINPDGLRWLIDNGYVKDLLRRGVDTLVVDELSKFKHTDSQRFKLLKPWLPRFKRRWGLTGSPASNGLMDLFGQAYVIDLGDRLGRYITHYRHQYFTPGRSFGVRGACEWNPQPDAEQRIFDKLADIALSMRAEDHLDLPDLFYQDLYVKLPKPARKAYTELAEDLITAIDTKVVTAANAGVASNKCQQVASGGLYVEQDLKRETLQLHDEKTEAVKDLVDELQGSPLLLLYAFDHDLARLRKVLGKDLPALNGHTPDKEASRVIAAWNAGEIPVLAGHPASMGHGLNLQRGGCSTICWYSLTWDLELYEQANRRIYRQGNEAERIIIYRVMARDTVDEIIAQVLAGKHRTQDGIFEALKSHLKKSVQPTRAG